MREKSREFSHSIRFEGNGWGNKRGKNVYSKILIFSLMQERCFEYPLIQLCWNIAIISVHLPIKKKQ